MNPLYDLASRALAVVIVPTVIVGSFFIPPNHTRWPEGTYQNLQYQAKVTQRPSMTGYQFGKVLLLSVKQDNELIALYRDGRWVLIRSEYKDEVLNIMKELN